MRRTAGNLGPRLALAALAIVSAGGCATRPASAPGLTLGIVDSAGYSAYVESVFRFQNKVVDAIAARSMDAPEFADAALVDAEDTLVAHCRYLNQAAATVADGQSVGMDLKVNVIHTVSDCARAAHDAAALIEMDADPSIAARETRQ